MEASVHNYCIIYALIIHIRHKNLLCLSPNHVVHYFLNVLRLKGLHSCPYFATKKAVTVNLPEWLCS